MLSEGRSVHSLTRLANNGADGGSGTTTSIGTVVRSWFGDVACPSSAVTKTVPPATRRCSHATSLIGEPRRLGTTSHWTRVLGKMEEREPGGVVMVVVYSLRTGKRKLELSSTTCGLQIRLYTCCILKWKLARCSVVRRGTAAKRDSDPSSCQASFLPL